ncbi:MAG: PHP domain-containing protein [Candidatus Lokiarchaeota archaeon]|nr:PHP domain-containing protein [Candidatus Lokiarchaeota archaeon]
MPFPEINLHIHSTFSDGKNTIRQIVESALNVNLDYIAITDHFTNSWKNWVTKLENTDTIEEYLGEITLCQDYLREYKKNLIVFKGLEVDLGSSLRFIRAHIQASKFDLILFEYLQDVDTIAFVKNIINFWKRTIRNIDELPIIGLAHFDPSYFIHGNLDILISFLKDYSIYFEFNSSYPSYYSRQNEIFFEKLRENNIPVAIGCDSHSVSSLNNIEEPLEMIKYYNLENNLQYLISILENRC